MIRVLVIMAICIGILFPVSLEAQTPLEKHSYVQLSSNADLLGYLVQLQDETKGFSLDTSVYTFSGHSIPVVHITGKINPQEKKLKILLFGQQHGDEPSGKEGLIMLIRTLAKNKQIDWLSNLDITIVPMVNPDGADLSTRKNGRGVDLNRNHLILSEIESRLIHKLYWQILPHLTVDFHEYFPYTGSWIKYGATKNFDEQMGCLTNCNISPALRTYERTQFLPLVAEELKHNNISIHEYLVGGPPGVERIRYSTADINDGRQGLGIFGSLSLIIEGKNGKTLLDDIAGRTEKQYKTGLAIIKIASENASRIMQLVESTRMQLASKKSNSYVYTSFEHFTDSHYLQFTARSVATNKDTLITVKDFNPIVKGLDSVKAPRGYLIRKSDSTLVHWLGKIGLIPLNYIPADGDMISEYRLLGKQVCVKEETNWDKYQVEKHPVTIVAKDYYYYNLENISSIACIMALEPVSMYGLVQYKDFNYLLVDPFHFPILRLE
ncbi:MAG: hypothetical protein LWX56_10615 [Ignavibacteria bacterium]|nr:hypothetical protein [Ignavibacteria bacterium]